MWRWWRENNRNEEEEEEGKMGIKKLIAGGGKYKMKRRGVSKALLAV